jgi:hypothetical protein
MIAISPRRAGKSMLPFLSAERVQERRSGRFQILLQPRGAIAVAARPGLGAILVAALAAVVRILHFCEVEVFFPIRPFFLQRRGTVADFHPAHGLVSAKPRFAHVAQIFALGNGALPQGLVLNGLKQIAFAAGLNAGSNQIAHGNSVFCRMTQADDEPANSSASSGAKAHVFIGFERHG